MWTTVFKTIIETIQSDDTLTNDATLVVSMSASTKYHVRGMAFFTTGNTPDFKYAFACPTSPTYVTGNHSSGLPGGSSAFRAIESTCANTTALAGSSSSTHGVVTFDWLVQNGANAGTFGFQWAQNTSTASDTSVEAGSYLEWAVVQ